jgi:curli production assembly/transport component CsgG
LEQEVLVVMVIRAAILSLIILLSGCASIPRWSEQPQECNPATWEEGVDYPGDLWNVIKASGRIFERALPFICVEEPEVIRMPSYIELLKLPPAEKKPIVAVYTFQDLTGQRKSVQNIASFSTAVTQGGTEMLIDALKAAGDGTWFRVVERKGIDHLVRERQIIRSGREEAAKVLGEEAPTLGPMLFAGMIIEGGIIGYDSNIMTGGRGARTLGIGGSRQYRQDQVTVSLRAVSVLTGEVLLNVQAKKTIFSYGSSGDIFRFIEQGTQLIEFEDGTGKNESVTYSVRTAIEAAVLELVNQGHERGLWKIKGRE